MNRITSIHETDKKECPAGGETTGPGLVVTWKSAPGNHRKHDGATVEDLIEAAVDRLHFYQRTKFACNYNRSALTFLNNALQQLDRRTADRERRHVKGKCKT